MRRSGFATNKDGFGTSPYTLPRPDFLAAGGGGGDTRACCSNASTRAATVPPAVIRRGAGGLGRDRGEIALGDCTNVGITLSSVLLSVPDGMLIESGPGRTPKLDNVDEESPLPELA